MNNLPLLRILSADRITPALDALENPDASLAAGAFGSSLAGFLQAGGGDLPALPAVARGGEALPGAGKHLPPASAEGLPIAELPGRAAEPTAAAIPVTGLPAGAAAASPAATPENGSAPGPAPAAPGAAALPRGETAAALAVPPAGQPQADGAAAPAGTGNPHGLLPADADRGAAAIRLHPGRAALTGNGPAGAGAAVLTRDSAGGHRVAGPSLAKPAATAGDASSSTDPRGAYAARGTGVRLQADAATRSSAEDAVEGLGEKAPAGQPAKFAGPPAHGPTAAAPLSAVAAAPSAAPGPATVTPAAAVPPAVLPAIDMPPGADGWGEALGDRVIMMAGRRVQSADIRLNPAELGPLRVQVSVDDGTVSVSFHAQHAVTRDAIEQALPRLRDLLDDSGLALGDASVSDQGTPREDAEPRHEPVLYGAGRADEGTSTGIAEAAPAVARRLATPSLIDLFA